MEAGHKPSDALDRRLAPLLLLGVGHAAAAADDGDGISVYSLPRGEMLHLPGGRAFVRGHRVWTTPQGWLLMARRGLPETFLWDPFTGTRIGLSPDHDGTVLAVDHWRRRCLLSRRRPTDPGCVVLVVDLQDTVLWHCRPALGRGEEEDQQWAKHEYLQPGTPHHEHRDDVLRAIGRLTAEDGSKLLVDLVDHRLAVLELSSPDQPAVTVVAAEGVSLACSYNSTHLVESDGELYYVWFSHPIQCRRIVARVSVYKLDYMAAKGSAQWVKVKSLGRGRSFFIGQDRIGASFDADEAGLKPNCIYYWLPKNRAALYVHDIERGTTAVHNLYPDDLSYHLSPAITMMPTAR
uniref:KIB1-4 beta-propeller domain-containing protein n=1 Tax=Oryza meridionalis TaxID=40149 RepID=A0A0E0DJE1_9ORYZ